jgi:carbonic anhydrase/acetyltransferase-like protein (isoleucine patch superfamily)
VVLDGAEVGPESMVGAGAVVPPGMKVPPRTLVLGTPARVARPLRDAELAHLRESARRYVELADRHRREGPGP